MKEQHRLTITRRPSDGVIWSAECSCGAWRQDYPPSGSYARAAHAEHALPLLEPKEELSEAEQAERMLREFGL